MPKKPFIILPVLLLFFFSLFIGIDRFVHRKSLRFSISKIAATHETSNIWDVPPLSYEEKNELDSIFNQTFSFFGKSTHAYLFLSEDQKYIIKFLKPHASRLKSWMVYIPLSFNPYYQESRQKLEEQKKIFTAYKTAFTELKEETGLVYLHINPTRILNKKLSIFDKNRKNFIVDLDKTSFYIQKRAQLIYPRISELMRIGDIEHAKNIITSVFSLIDFLGKKGVCDEDLTLYKNFGIIDDKAVQLVISKLKINSHTDYANSYKQKISIITEPFRRWIKKNYPELLEHFDEKFNAVKRLPTN